MQINEREETAQIFINDEEEREHMKHLLLRLQYVLCFEMEGTRFYGKHATKEDKEHLKFTEKNNIKKNQED